MSAIVPIAWDSNEPDDNLGKFILVKILDLFGLNKEYLLKTEQNYVRNFIY